MPAHGRGLGLRQLLLQESVDAGCRGTAQPSEESDRPLALAGEHVPADAHEDEGGQQQPDSAHPYASPGPLRGPQHRLKTASHTAARVGAKPASCIK